MPLVLLHGLATSRVIWRRVVPLLDGDAVALDVPGFGDAAPVGPGFSLPEVAAALLRSLDGVPRPFDLVGHSLGGAVALTLASLEPGAVGRLVLAAPAGLRPVPLPLARAFGAGAALAIPVRRRGAFAAGTAWGRRLLMSPGTAEPAALPPAEVRAMLDASAGATRIAPALATAASCDLRATLRTLEVPVGAVWGARDRIVRPGGVDTVRALRPEAPVRVIPRTGHIPMMERPEAFVDALGDVLSRLGNIEARTVS